MTTEELRDIHRQIVSGQLIEHKPGTREHVQHAIRMSSVVAMRALFSKCCIRRRPESLDNNGKPISGLPPLRKVHVSIEMSLAEAEAFKTIKDNVLKEM